MKLSEEMVIRKDITIEDWIQEVSNLESWINILDRRIANGKWDIEDITKMNNKLRETIVCQKTTIAKLQKQIQGNTNEIK